MKKQNHYHNHITFELVQTLFHISLYANLKLSRVFLPETNKEQTKSLLFHVQLSRYLQIKGLFNVKNIFRLFLLSPWSNFKKQKL